MRVKRLVSAPFEVNVHVVEEDGRALVVDASSGLDWDAFGPRLADALRGLAVEAIYLTHLHVDHVGGAAKLARMTGAPLLMHEDEAYAVEQGDALLTGGALFGVEQEAWPVRTLREGDAVQLGARRFEVLLVPGHSPAHTALWEPESRSLLSGDVVFAHGSFGRVDLPGADARAMLRSLERLAALDAENLYPGHMEDVEGNAREAILESLDNARLML
ncbi:MAG TPA: MBL fold metallo-hydrolase [Candidatus Thermoplasmatota archaeon]|nr:MBL fold metallo-hydrolase [Candidatus Thermoplasmatota archaeon]